jgi:hypothetical protein
MPRRVGPGVNEAAGEPLRKLKRCRVNRQRLPCIRQPRGQPRNHGETPSPLSVSISPFCEEAPNREWRL